MSIIGKGVGVWGNTIFYYFLCLLVVLIFPEVNLMQGWVGGNAVF